MGSISQTSNPDSGITKYTEFILYVDSQEPQIHELWCLGLYSINREVHPTDLLEVVTGTVEEFTTGYLAENGRIILIIRKLSINVSVQFLRIPDFVWGSGLSFIPNLQDPTESTGWGNGGTSKSELGNEPVCILYKY